MYNSLRILLIDDNPDDRALVMRELRREFSDLYVEQIIEAKGLAQALEVGDFRLVITDYQLRWTNGLDVLRTIKAKYPDRPVIMFTATGSEEIAVEAMKAGLDDYVLKSPKHLIRLSAAVRLSLKRAQECKAAKEALARYQRLFDGVPVGLYRTTPEGQILEVNPALVEMMGYLDQEALLAINVSDQYVNPEERRRWQARIEHDGIVRAYEMQYRRRDGTILWVEDNARAVRDTEGRVMYYEGSLEDITARKRTEEQLRLQGTALETAADAIVITDPNGVIQWVNPAFIRLTGYTSAEAIGQSIRLLKSGKQDQEFYKNLWETILSGQVWRGEIVDRRKDGTLFTSEMTIAPVRTAGGETTHFITISRDVTERKRMEERIGEQLQILTALYAGVQQLTESLDPQAVATRIAASCVEIFGVRLAWLGRAEPDGRVEVIAQFPSDHPYPRQIHVCWDETSHGQGPTGRAIRTGLPEVTTDIATDLRFQPWQEAALAQEFSCTAAFPLISRGRTFGALSLYSDTPGFFTAERLEMFQAFAHQAATALENARLFTESQRRIQELEALFTLSARLRSVQTPHEAISILLAEARRALDADAGLVELCDPDGEHFTIAGADGSLAPNAGRRFSIEQSISGQVLHARQPYASDDYAADPHHAQTDLYHVEETGPAAFVPLLSEEALLGALMVARHRSPQARPFAPDEVRLLAAMGEMAGNALRRMDLYADALRRLQQVQALRNIDMAITGSLDPRVTLRVVLDEVTMQLGVDAAAVLLFKPDTLTLEYAAGRGFHSELIQHTRLHLGEGYAGRVALERRPLGVGDLIQVDDSERFRLLQEEGFEAYYAAPLIAKDHVLGVLETFHRTPRGFGREWLEFLEALAGQAALALENAGLYQELQAYAADLERRVAERTVALQAANEQLRQAHEEVSRALKQEQELSELKSRFLSMASHEFRTPLTTIFSSAELLEHYGPRWPPEKRLTHLHRIQATVQRMTALLDDVLLVSRAEADRLEFTPQPLDLLPLCRDLVEEFRLGVGAQHRLVLDLARLEDVTSLPANMDERLLRYTLSNLLSNAIKYSPAGSEVRLAVRRQADRVIFSVADRGIGIPPKDQARLFEPFHRAGNVGAIPGTGLGLNIVKRAVDLHGGAIEVHSEVDQGTTVIVDLPLDTAAASL